jgi:RloB-like protein
MPDRNYKKGSPHRDSRLFVIVAEGEREDEYFRYFHEQNQRVQIKIVPREGQSSAPKLFLNRLNKYQEDGLWSPQDNDVLWFVLDVDRWEREHIQELIDACERDKQWYIAISNPCFEVWLLYHIEDNLETIGDNLKHELHLRTQATGKGIPFNFCPKIAIGAANAKKNDSSPSQTFPNHKQTKVYQLAEQLLEKLGKNWLKY